MSPLLRAFLRQAKTPDQQRLYKLSKAKVAKQYLHGREFAV